jgi:crooked neck
VIPHNVFTFGKIWLMAAQLEVRQKDLPAARKLLGKAIGMCPKENIFKGYIDLELQLGEIERCRELYAKYLETMSYNCAAWKAFSDLEMSVGETARARALFEMAVSLPELDMPEMLWKAYIDFEIGEREGGHVRQLYKRLLEKTSHVKVWISYGKFVLTDNLEMVLAAQEDSGAAGVSVTTEAGALAVAGATFDPVDMVSEVREIFEAGYDNMKEAGLKEERLMLLEAWRDAEALLGDHGLPADTAAVEAKLPRKVKMRRMATAEDGSELGYEDYFDYIFPDDEKKSGSLKLLEKAMMWKQKMANSNSDAGEGADDSVLGKRSAEDIDIDDI